jgi:tight adherence protein B
MMAWCLALVVLSVLLFLPTSPARHLTNRLSTGGEPGEVKSTAQPRLPWRSPWLLLALGVGAVIAVHRILGPATAAAGAAILIVVATSLGLLVQEVRTRKASQARVQVAQACRALASQIQVGRTPTEALRSAAADSPVLSEASQTQALGGDVTTVWRTESSRPGHSGLADLARAWQVSTETGAPLAPSLQQVSAALTADVALRTVIAAELAAPRASGKIMAVLPFCGLGMGYLLGGDPLDFVFSSPYGRACLVLGVGLAAAGVLWIDRLSRLAAEAL